MFAIYTLKIFFARSSQR